VPGRGSGHSEHRPKPARTEVSPSARPQPGSYGCPVTRQAARPDPGTIQYSIITTTALRG